VLHAGGDGRPRVQLVVQGPGASDVAQQLQLRLELLRDATFVDALSAAVHGGTAVEAQPRDAAWTESGTEGSSDDSWLVPERAGLRSVPPQPPLPGFTPFGGLPLDVRRLAVQLGGAEVANETRIAHAWRRGAADRDYLALDE
jgi:hypothetical protein